VNVSNVQTISPPRRAGFTLVELLIVITVIGLVVAMIMVIGGKVIDRQKHSVTQQIMSNVMLAIDQFQEKPPLGQIYNRRNAPTFGALPPYQLARPTNNIRGAAELLEPAADQPGGGNGTLEDRLARDVFNTAAFATDTSRIDLSDDALPGLHDDNRALYAYLKLYAKEALAQVPQNALKPLSNDPEFINPGANAANEDARIEVLGFHDGWGVPLDYMLYVKLEWGQIVDNTGNVVAGVRVVDRKPVLVSRGVSDEEFAAQVAAYQAGGNPSVFTKEKWIFSPAFPAPPANVDAQGVFQATNSSGNGWVRVRSVGDYFGYVPGQDN
jgi:prepilin-type N-terminal cleavage/methylation domain-containing protein